MKVVAARVEEDSDGVTSTGVSLVAPSPVACRRACDPPGDENTPGARLPGTSRPRVTVPLLGTRAPLAVDLAAVTACEGCSLLQGWTVVISSDIAHIFIALPLKMTTVDCCFGCELGL